MNKRVPDAYTIGNKGIYDELLKSDGPKQKLGKRDDIDGKPYEGGVVWKTEAEARAWLYIPDSNGQAFGRLGNKMVDFGNGPVLCDVYSLEFQNDWETDTYYSEEDNLHFLLYDAGIISLKGSRENEKISNHSGCGSDRYQRNGSCR